MSQAKNDLSFLEFLQSHRRGELLGEAAERLEELLEAVGETGGKGELTIKLPFCLNKAGQIECTPTVTCKKPARPLGTGIYYRSPDNRLTRRDPNQADLLDDLEARRERDSQAH